MRKTSAIFESIELSLLLLTKKEKKNLIYLSIYAGSSLTSILSDAAGAVPKVKVVPEMV